MISPLAGLSYVVPQWCWYSSYGCNIYHILTGKPRHQKSRMSSLNVNVSLIHEQDLDEEDSHTDPQHPQHLGQLSVVSKYVWPELPARNNRQMSLEDPEFVNVTEVTRNNMNIVCHVLKERLGSPYNASPLLSHALSVIGRPSFPKPQMPFLLILRSIFKWPQCSSFRKDCHVAIFY